MSRAYYYVRSDSEWAIRYKVAVTYRNAGRAERALYRTREEAKRGADFLRFQGATNVCVRPS